MIGNVALIARALATIWPLECVRDRDDKSARSRQICGGQYSGAAALPVISQCRPE
jgi:hypothetical protein